MRALDAEVEPLREGLLFVLDEDKVVVPAGAQPDESAG